MSTQSDPFGKVGSFVERGKRVADGAHYTQPGDRPKSSAASEAYTAAYWKAKSEGKTIDESARIAREAMRSRS